MSTALVLPEGTPTGARQLGLRTAPSLRLSIGFRNPQRNNAPDKLDHFRAKEGADGSFKQAATRFHEVYGPEPKAIDIMLPSRLEDALRIEYLAFKGNPSDPLGGVMVARGRTNFATLPYCGGPDTLTAWDEDGTVRQVETKGIDATTREPLDEVARAFTLMLCTTLRVGLPQVLGFGSFAEITSKSLASTDRLWSKLRDWYSMFPNGTITFAMEPKLVVRPAIARPRVLDKKSNTWKRIRSKVYVLDVVDPEPVSAMLKRLDQFNSATRPVLDIGPPVAEIEAGDPPPGAAPVSAASVDDGEEITDAEVVEESGSAAHPGTESSALPPADPEKIDAGPEPGTDASSQVPAGVEQDELPVAAPSASSEPVGEEPVLEVSSPEAPAPDDGITDADRALAEEASKLKPPFGSYQNVTLAGVMKNKNGADWFSYALKLSIEGKQFAKDQKFERALWAFVKVHLPDLYQAHHKEAK